jgi:hypothetical protein
VRAMDTPTPAIWSTFPDLANLRDLGGSRTPDARRTRRGRPVDSLTAHLVEEVAA